MQPTCPARECAHISAAIFGPAPRSSDQPARSRMWTQVSRPATPVSGAPASSADSAKVAASCPQALITPPPADNAEAATVASRQR